MTIYWLRQAANDMYFKALTFKLLSCQPEPVEGGFITKNRVRQANPDTLLIAEFVIGCAVGYCTIKKCFNQNLHFPFG